MAKAQGPEFLRYCIPIIEVLRDLGGSGRPAEVTDLVLERLSISEAEQEITNQNGGSRVRNQVAWARFYLVKAGLLSSSSGRSMGCNRRIRGWRLLAGRTAYGRLGCQEVLVLSGSFERTQR